MTNVTEGIRSCNSQGQQRMELMFTAGIANFWFDAIDKSIEAHANQEHGPEYCQLLSGFYVVSRHSTAVDDGGRRPNVANIFVANIVTAVISMTAEIGSHDHAERTKP